MQPDADGKYPYTGSVDCAIKTFKSGGPFKFYTGFPVYFVRIAPHVMAWHSLLSTVFLPSFFLLNYISSYMLLFPIADDLDFPQPNPKIGEIFWVVNSIQL